MSMTVRVKMALQSADIARDAFQRRFHGTTVKGNKISGRVTLPGRTYGNWFTLNTDTMELSCDGDHKKQTLDELGKAYAAEEVIAAAVANGYAWSEELNEDQELVLVVEGL